MSGPERGRISERPLGTLGLRDRRAGRGEDGRLRTAITADRRARDQRLDLVTGDCLEFEQGTSDLVKLIDVAGDQFGRSLVTILDQATDAAPLTL